MPVQGENVVHELSRRVARLWETCSNRDLFASDEQWRKRTRACVETTASLVCCTNTKLEWFGDIIEVLSDIGSAENTREHSTTRLDQSFLVRWTCLSIAVLRPALDQESLREELAFAVSSFAYLGSQDSTDDLRNDEQALENAQKIDGGIWEALQSIQDLCRASSSGADLTLEQLRENLRSHESQVADLERINTSVYTEQISFYLSAFYHELDRVTHKLVRRLPGVQFDDSPFERASFSRALDLLTATVEPQLVFPHRQLRALCSLGPRLRDIIEGWNIEDPELRRTLDSLKTVGNVDTWPTFSRRPMERQLARLQDIRDSSGFAITVELFFVALGQLLATSSSESHHSLFIGTFKSITSDWKKYRGSRGTQQVLLDVVCDIAMRRPRYGDPSRIAFPSYIADKLLVLLRNVLEGQPGSHIDDVVENLHTALPGIYGERRKFLDRALEVIAQSRAPGSVPLF
ncbi:hypothetical protein BJV78DRAFT_416711 [Lactifluus subvellereus]|nr:hypothetical protein BJV78DRAFT_416711 [Lactifluus subvellereus]